MFTRFCAPRGRFNLPRLTHTGFFQCFAFCRKLWMELGFLVTAEECVQTAHKGSKNFWKNHRTFKKKKKKKKTSYNTNS
eukprot:3257655-Amphidinium_carterae.1